MTHKELLHRSIKLIPPLSSNLHKGSSGRIAIVGGSFEYTGAPFYAAISSLRAGADISFVFCTEAAAVPIKSYSPEVIVLPCLDTDLNKAIARLGSLHSIVVGPGLGRDDKILLNAKTIVLEALSQKKQIVLDGDALFLLAKDIDFREKISGAKVLLTPNKVEFRRLYQSIFNKEPSVVAFPKPLYSYWFEAKEVDENHFAFDTLKLAEALNVTIFHKGPVDIITNGKVVAVNSRYGSTRRCGGQGDIVAGTMGVFLAWKDILALTDDDSSVIAGFAVSNLVRKANGIAFARKKRSLVTPDIIEDLGSAFEEVFNAL